MTIDPYYFFMLIISAFVLWSALRLTSFFYSFSNTQLFVKVRWFWSDWRDSFFFSFGFTRPWTTTTTTTTTTPKQRLDNGWTALIVVWFDESVTVQYEVVKRRISSPPADNGRSLFDSARCLTFSSPEPDLGSEVGSIVCPCWMGRRSSLVIDSDVEISSRSDLGMTDDPSMGDTSMMSDILDRAAGNCDGILLTLWNRVMDSPRER